jgi:hypothetical protein
MAEFDLTNYLNSRVASNDLGVVDSPSVSADQLKLQKLQEAAQKHQDGVFNKAMQLRQQANDSFVGRLSLDSGALRTGTNLAVIGGNSIGNVSGNMGAAFNALQSLAISANIPDSVIAADARRVNGTATPADLELLSLPAGETSKRKQMTIADYERLNGAQTNQQRLENWKSKIRDTKDLREFFDNSNTVDPTKTNELITDLRKRNAGAIAGFDRGSELLDKGQYAKAFGEYLSNAPGAIAAFVPAAVDNPVGALELLASQTGNILSLGSGKVAAALTNAAYGSDIYNQSVEATTTNSGLPTSKERSDALRLAGVATASETVGDLALGIAPGVKAAAIATADTTNIALALAKAASKATGKAAVSAAGEGITEAVQGRLENAATYKDNNFASDLESFNVGALVGAGLKPTSVAVGLANEVVKRIPAPDVAIADAVINTATDVAGAIKDKFAPLKVDKEAAVTNNDPAEYLKPAEATKKQWVDAIDVFVKNSSLDGKSDTDKQENIRRAEEEVLIPLEEEVNNLKKMTTEGKQELLAEVVQGYQQQLSEATDPKDKARIEKLIGAANVFYNLPVDPKEEKIANKKLAILNPQLTEVNNLFVGLEAAATAEVAPDKLVALADAITAPKTGSDVSVDTQAVAGFVVRAMRSKAAPTPEVVAAIDNVIASGLATPEQLTTLRNVSAEYKAALGIKTSSDVQNTVLYGSKQQGTTPGKNFKGFVQYYADFNKSDTQGAKQTSFDKFKSFYENQQSKADALSKIKVGQYIYKTVDNSYVITDKPQAGLKTAFDITKGLVGAKKVVENINKALEVATPLLNGMATRLNLPIEINNGKQTIETKQTEEKRPEVVGTTKEGVRTEPTESGQVETQVSTAAVNNIVNSAAGKQIESELVTLATELLNDNTILKSTETRLDTNTTGKAESSVDTKSQEAVTKQKTDSLPRDSEASSAVVNDTGSEQATSTKVSALPAQHLVNKSFSKIKQDLKRYQELLECLKAT